MHTFSKRYGIVIGVSNYDPTEQVTKLEFAKNDAVEIYSTLLTRCGFSPDQLRLFANGIDASSKVPHQAPTRANILKALNYASTQAGENDLILLFFAGHGVEISSHPYLITEDTKMDVLRETAIEVNALNAMLKESKARCVFRIFDACRAPFAVGRGLAGIMTDVLERALSIPAKGWATFSACSSGEVSYENGEFQHGVFTHFLCEGIKGKGANKQGAITLDSLVDYVRHSVGTWCDSQSLKQTPHVQSDLSGMLYLGKVAEQQTVASVAPDNPLEHLATGLVTHLSAVPADARRLTYTSDDERDHFLELVKQNCETLLNGTVVPSLDIALDKRVLELHQWNHDAWGNIHNEADRLKVKAEFQGNAKSLRISFTSNEVVVPSSELNIAIAKFTFFYWLYYSHRFQVSSGSEAFKASPMEHHGFFTFKPNATRNEHAVAHTIREVFSRCSVQNLKWTEQHSSYVNQRIDPLRRIEKIIE